jgi:L-seryl-tRNA(Ser) seleniumtransferase
LNDLICQLTGAEAALVVNNNASALLLGLAAIAGGKEVIVSRGEAVEIGGGFRIPDVLRQSGATLVEVGTTNKTYVRDYEAAITENTGAILAVHASNFRVVGFTHAPDLRELVELGKRQSIPVLHDLGSGCLLDTAQFGLAHEPMPQESVDAGVSLAFFSGDKLLGGPQAGIIVGSDDLVSVVSKHPLARAVRIDKADMAALAATLLHYVRGEATSKIPVWSMVSATLDSLTDRAERWQAAIGGPTSIASGQSTIGGGSLPGEVLPSMLLSVDAGKTSGGADALAAKLRRVSPPIVGRIESEQVLLDPRTILPRQEDELVQGVSQALAEE